MGTPPHDSVPAVARSPAAAPRPIRAGPWTHRCARMATRTAARCGALPGTPPHPKRPLSLAGQAPPSARAPRPGLAGCGCTPRRSGGSCRRRTAEGRSAQLRPPALRPRMAALALHARPAGKRPPAGSRCGRQPHRLPRGRLPGLRLPTARALRTPGQPPGHGDAGRMTALWAAALQARLAGVIAPGNGGGTPRGGIRRSPLRSRAATARTRDCGADEPRRGAGGPSAADPAPCAGSGWPGPAWPWRTRT